MSDISKGASTFPKAAFVTAMHSALVVWLVGCATGFHPSPGLCAVLVAEAMTFAASVALVVRGVA